jgi:hypothetical protein
MLLADYIVGLHRCLSDFFGLGVPERFQKVPTV